jgi:hypothetical protein
MEQVKLTSDDVTYFHSMLDRITHENSSFAISRQTAALKRLLNSYQVNGDISFPTIRPEIDKIVDSFRPVSADVVKAISERAKAICKGCIFHDDNCLVNLLFITFKSLELKKKVEFKDLRPNVRIAF